MIVTSDKPVTILGGAPVLEPVLNQCLARAPAIVAADSGAGHAVARGLAPLATLGDLDSLDAGARAALPAGTLREIAEQDTTDFGKVLRNVRAPFCLAAGVTGGRVDHTLAALSTLAAHAAQPGAMPCVLVSEHDVIFAVRERVTLDLPVGSRVSLYPLAPVRGRSEGLEWPIEGLTLGPRAQLGTSNRTTARAVTLEFDAPEALVFLPASALEAVLAGLGL